MGDEPKRPPLSSRSGGEGREKEARKRPGHAAPTRAQRQARTRLRGIISGLAEDALTRDVQGGKLTPGEADVCRSTLGSVVDRLDVPALERLHRNLKGFHWYATDDALNDDHRRRFGPHDERVLGYFDPNDSTIHLTAESDADTHAHEIAHGIDGEAFEITARRAWIVAYNRERGRLGSAAYPSSNPCEWWAELVRIALLEPDNWAEVRKRLPRSAAFLEGVIHE